MTKKLMDNRNRKILKNFDFVIMEGKMKKYKRVSIFTALKNHPDAYTDARQQGVGIITSDTLRPVWELQGVFPVNLQKMLKINLYK